MVSVKVFRKSDGERRKDYPPSTFPPECQTLPILTHIVQSFVTKEGFSHSST